MPWPHSDSELNRIYSWAIMNRKLDRFLGLPNIRRAIPCGTQMDQNGNEKQYASIALIGERICYASVGPRKNVLGDFRAKNMLGGYGKK